MLQGLNIGEVGMWYLKAIPLMNATHSHLPPLDTLPVDVDYSASLIRMFLTFIALIALLLVTYVALKKWISIREEKGSTDRSIYVLEKKMLSPKTILYLVEVEGKKIVLAESQLEIRRLDVVSCKSPFSNSEEINE